MKTENIRYKNTEKFTPEVIDEVLEVQKKSGLTAENLLNKARDKSSSLYEFFDWDDSSAGEKWRLHQARNVINEVKIFVEDKEIRAFENVVIEVKDIETDNSLNTSISRREYLPTVEVMSKEEYRTQIIRRALIEASYWKEKHSQLIELEPIFSLISKTSEKWQALKK